MGKRKNRRTANLRQRAGTDLVSAKIADRAVVENDPAAAAWREHWGADIDGDEVAALRRDQVVHTLGNLALVSGKLNPTLSNRPWADTEARDRGLGSVGKLSYLLRHSQLTPTTARMGTYRSTLASTALPDWLRQQTQDSAPTAPRRPPGVGHR